MLIEDLKLSIGIPIYNEQDVLLELANRLRAVLDSMKCRSSHVVFVDDGSSDATSEILDKLCKEDARFAAVHLSRNFGHQAALSAAIDHADGDCLVLMDGDLQDRPEAIPEFVDCFLDGCDVVYSMRVKRKEGLLMRAAYHTFYRIFALFSDIRAPLDSGDFCLLSRRAVESLRTTREQTRYIRGLRSWIGFRQKGIPVERDARAAGAPKYTFGRLLKLAADGLFSFSTFPLRLATFLGTAAICAAMLYSLYALYVRLVLDAAPEGFTALLFVVVFMGGVQLMVLGMLGEYLGRIYNEVKSRPLYVVDRIDGLGATVAAVKGSDQ